MFNIEKVVPIPAKSGHGRPVKYPFRGMEVGDSFFVPITEGRSPNVVGGLVSSRGTQVFGPGGITRRRVEENGVDGFRVWRVK